MKTQQLHWTAATGWNATQLAHATPPTFVWVFGGRAALAGDSLRLLAEMAPRDVIFGCSTAGEIAGDRVFDDTVVATAVWLEKGSARFSCASVESGDAEAAGGRLAEGLPKDGLRHIVVVSDGTQVNGTALVLGVQRTLPRNTTVSGGLAGDGDAMQNTLVVFGGEVRFGAVAALGIYGDVKVGTGSLGGWDAFGPVRAVTGSAANVLRSLDGQPALELYKKYLGPHAAQLPSSAMSFPLQVRLGEEREPVVRAILAVDESQGTMTFAGDIPEGATAQLMRANFDRLIDGAAGAADAAIEDFEPQLALLVSCVGRKWILKQRTEEEVEAVRNVVGADCVMTGFYSYGELAPTSKGGICHLHNETMAITTFAED